MPGAVTPTNPWRIPALLASVMLLTALPSMFLVWDRGIAGAISFLSSDAFYYIRIAERSSPGFYTFDGELPTNGFHPGWQWLLTWIYAALGQPSAPQAVALSFGCSLGLVTLASATAAWALYRQTGSAFATLAIVPGPFAFLAVLATDGRFGGMWSNVNGMESGLSLLFGSAIIALIRTAPEAETAAWTGFPLKRRVLLGTLLGLATLTRLDDVFMAVAVLGHALAVGRRALGTTLRRLVPIALPIAILIGGYLAFNQAYSEMLLPISGKIKRGFALPQNAFWTLGAFAWPIQKALGGLVSFEFDLGQHQRLMARIVQMLGPALIAALGSLWLRRNPAALGGYRALLPLLWFVLLKAAYNFFGVKLWNQGYWYYATSILIVNVFVLLWAHEQLTAVLRQGNLSPSARTLRLTQFGYALFVILLAGNHLYETAYQPSLQNLIAFWTDRSTVRRELEARIHKPSLIEIDDGIVAHTLGFRSMTGLGFALDKEAAEAHQRRSLLEMAARRGYNVIGTVNYPFSENITSEWTTTIKPLGILARQELAGFRFRLLYRHPASGATFVQFQPIAP